MTNKVYVVSIGNKPNKESKVYVSYNNSVYADVEVAKAVALNLLAERIGYETENFDRIFEDDDSEIYSWEKGGFKVEVERFWVD